MVRRFTRLCNQLKDKRAFEAMIVTPGTAQLFQQKTEE